ncbi:PilZ domain-containing protein [Pseudoduganella chitinolytica]|uniref:PilZ domain-containing protein n=2 Tax=Pseudoduganella chitinolytica TaxID=34070 RepID=A0ABY8BDZ5_9BURK|nr:PilZ domain-containing protein [Pseudoduganella chitinolytica]
MLYATPLAGAPGPWHTVVEQITEQRRAHIRRLLQIEAYVFAEGGQPRLPAQVIDIARMGVGFILPVRLPDRPRYWMRFRFPGSDIVDEVEMVIVYNRPVGSKGRYHYGGRILAVTQECRERIVEYVTRGNPRMT